MDSDNDGYADDALDDNLSAVADDGHEECIATEDDFNEAMRWVVGTNLEWPSLEINSDYNLNDPVHYRDLK